MKYVPIMAQRCVKAKLYWAQGMTAESSVITRWHRGLNNGRFKVCNDDTTEREREESHIEVTFPLITEINLQSI